MYPGSSFVFYIPDDLVNALKKDGQGKAVMNTDNLPAFKIRVLGHRAWMQAQGVADKLDEYREMVNAGDHSKTVAASELHMDLVKQHVTGCDNFPDVESFDIKEVIEKDLLSPRHIAHLANAVLKQQSNEGIEREYKKKLDSLSESPTIDVEDEGVQVTGPAKTTQPS